MDSAASRILNQKFPCRAHVIRQLLELITAEALPATLYLYGHSGTGKTKLVKELLAQKGRDGVLCGAHFSCVEYYTGKLLMQSIGKEFLTGTEQQPPIDNAQDFVEALQRLDASKAYVIVLDGAERLRDLDIFGVLLSLQKLSRLNVCVVLIGQLPLEKYYAMGGGNGIDMATLHFPQYSKTETLQILSMDFPRVKTLLRTQIQRTQATNKRCAEELRIVEQLEPELFNNYLNLYLSVFYKACRDLPELKSTAYKYFAIYVRPIISGEIDKADVSRLWRQISGPLKEALSSVYMRCEQQAVDGGAQTELVAADHIRKFPQSVQLPYYGKYLLIAAYLASYNAAKNDKRIFLKYNGKQRKNMHTVNANAKLTEKMCTSLGPKAFSIDRLLAIFYAILEERVGLTCNILSQISTLVHLKLLSFVSGENNVMDCGARLQCTVGLDFVTYIGKLVGFNVRQYLCDFM